MATLAESLAAWAADLRLKDVPARVIERTKLQTLSVLAAIYSGTASEGGRAVLRAVRGWRQEGPCTLLPSGEKASPHSALFAHTAFSMAYDFDDYCFMGHTGHSAVLTPLVIGEALGSDGKAVLEAMVAANEVAGRIGAACLIGPHNGQAWSFIHAAGASVAASKLMGLDAEKTADALSLAFMQPNYMLFPGFFSDAKLLTAAVPATAGLQAAHLAAAGLRGPRSILEPDGGFLHHFSFAPQTWALGGLGRAWVSDSLAYKPVPGCAYIDSGVEAAENLLREGLKPGDIGEVEVRAGKLTTTMERLGETFAPALSTVRITFSLRYSLAALFAHGRLTPREIARPDPATLEKWAERISLRYDPSLTLTTLRALQEFHIHPLAGLGLRDLVRVARLARVLGPPLDLEPGDLLLGPTMLRSWKRKVPEFESLEGLKFPFPAEVTVRLSGGGTRRALVEIPKGAPGRPLDEVKETVRAKFMQEAGPALGERANDAAALVEKMETLASPGALMELLPGEYR